jgi:ribonuclease D
MIFINRQEDFAEICKALEDAELVAIDTEFVRRDTYFPRLSLVQMVTPKFELIIDYLGIDDLAPLNNILQNPKIVKIFHSGLQDLEIFYRLFNQLPKNIFDTQIAANICGYGDAVSYGALCEICENVVIDKTHQAANWLKRPLSKDMLEYAINDVRYLIEIYYKLSEIINKSGLQNELSKKLTALVNPRNYEINAEKIWKKVRFRNKSPDFILKMQLLANLREELAREEDIPRRSFATDRDLTKLCINLPTNDKELINSKLNKNNFTKLEYKIKLFYLCAGLKSA